MTQFYGNKNLTTT